MGFFSNMTLIEENMDHSAVLSSSNHKESSNAMSNVGIPITVLVNLFFYFV